MRLARALRARRVLNSQAGSSKPQRWDRVHAGPNRNALGLRGRTQKLLGALKPTPKNLLQSITNRIANATDTGHMENPKHADVEERGTG